jgi:hypothetical protein
LDNNRNEAAMEKLAERVLSKVTGEFGRLMVINSASFAEFSFGVMLKILKTCIDKGIKELIMETHYMYHQTALECKAFFHPYGIEVKFVLGIETFNPSIRKFINKGYPDDLTMEAVARDYDAVNLLYGYQGCESEGEFKDEVLSCAKLFGHIQVNIFTNNTTSFKRDEDKINSFYKNLVPLFQQHQNILVFDYGRHNPIDNIGELGELK